jgi:predicted signal transduction protein with EAL and GGDEF domain
MMVAANVSNTQFAGRTLVSNVADALAASGLDSTGLEVEFVETVMLDEPDAILVILRAPWTILALAIRRSAICTAFRSARSKSISPSSPVSVKSG